MYTNVAAPNQQRPINECDNQLRLRRRARLQLTLQPRNGRQNPHRNPWIHNHRPEAKTLTTMPANHHVVRERAFFCRIAHGTAEVAATSSPPRIRRRSLGSSSMPTTSTFRVSCKIRSSFPSIWQTGSPIQGKESRAGPSSSTTLGTKASPDVSIDLCFPAISRSFLALRRVRAPSARTSPR